MRTDGIPPTDVTNDERREIMFKRIRTNKKTRTTRNNTVKLVFICHHSLEICIKL